MILAPVILTSHLILAKAERVKHWFYEVETINATVTAYDAEEFNEKNARGYAPRVGFSIACPRRIPFGTSVVITGFDEKRFSCDDRLALRYDDRFDLFVATRKQALLFGKRRMKVTIKYGK